MHWTFIYYAPGTDPAADRTVVETDGFRAVLTPVPDESLVTEIARQAVVEGSQLIELCGAFGPNWTGRVTEAVGPDVPVGAVAFGSEAAAALSRILGGHVG